MTALLEGSVTQVEKLSISRLVPIIAGLAAVAGLMIYLGVSARSPHQVVTHTGITVPTTIGLPLTGPTEASTTTIVTGVGTAQPSAPVSALALISAIGGLMSGLAAMGAVIVSVVALFRRRRSP